MAKITKDKTFPQYIHRACACAQSLASNLAGLSGKLSLSTSPLCANCESTLNTVPLLIEGFSALTVA